MEGAGNGKQGHFLFGVILDEQVNDIAFSIDHVCGRRSVTWDEQGVGARTTEMIVRRERTCDLEFWRWLWFSHCLFCDCVGNCHLAVFLRLATDNLQVEEKRVPRKIKPVTKEAKRIIVWVYGI